MYNADIARLFPLFKVDVIDTTGAGDAFNGGLATALAEVRSVEEAIAFASATAARSVTKQGSVKAMPCRADIDAFMSRAEH